MKINYNSLATKIIFFGLTLILLSLFIFSTISLVNQRAGLRRQILDKGYVFAEFTARSIYDDYVSFYTQSGDENFALFKKQLENKLSVNNDIINISLISTNGRVLFDSTELATGHYNKDNIKVMNDPELLNALKNNDSSYRDIEFMGEKMVEIIVPIKEVSGSHILAMRYILSFDSFNNQLIVVYRQLALSFLIVFIFVFLLSIPLYLSITRPITRLSALTKKISQGDLTAKIDAGEARDEIGVLTEDFNTMVDKLRLSNEKTISSNKKSEQEVKEKMNQAVAERDRLAAEAEQYKAELKKVKEKNDDLERLNKFMVGRELKIIDLKAKVADEKKEKKQL